MRGKRSEKTLHKLISHPTRKAILEYISQHGKASFSELSQIESKPGALYYHLNLLKGLVEQDSEKKYYLTELGNYAVELIKKGEMFEVPRETSTEKNLLSKILWDYISFQKIFEWLATYDRFLPFTTLLIILVVSFVFYESGVYPVLVLLDIHRYSDMLSILFHTVANWVVIFLVIFLALRLSLKVKSKSIYYMLFLTIPFVFVPLAIYGALVYFFIRLVTFPELFLSLLFLINLWSMWILTTCVRYFSKLSLRNSVLITLYIAYLSMAALFFLKGI